MTSLAQIIDQMQGHGLPLLPPGHPVLDGKIKRFGPGKKAWYSLREFDLRSGSRAISGAFGVWQGANNNSVSVKMDWAGVSADERAEAEQRMRAVERLAKEKREHMANYAASRARLQWQDSEPFDPVASEYLARKQVSAEGVRMSQDGKLLVPMRKYSLDGIQLVGLQKIAADGSKLFNKGMDKIGAACLLGKATDAPIIGICEGYATGRSVRMAVDLPVMVAFDAGNLLPVAQGLRNDFPDAHILFLADDDWQLEARYAERLLEDFKLVDAPPIDGIDRSLAASDGSAVSVMARWKDDASGVRYIEADVRSGRQARILRFENAGISRSMASAAAVDHASVIWPRFSDRGENKWTDFNDLHVEQSLDDVRGQLQAAIDAALNSTKHEKPKLSLVETPSPSAKKANQTREDAPADASAKGAWGREKKPPKEYGQDHWDTVNYLVENFTLIYGDDSAWDGAKRMIIKVANMRIAFGSDAVKFWLNNRDRKMVNKDDVVFDPAMAVDPLMTVNLFDGIKMKPKQGECGNIIKLLLHLCGNNAEVMVWVMRWLAYPLQHPGAKMRSSVIVHGDEGSGKNLLFESVVGRIYGEYGGVIGNAQIESAFNEWASRKLFLVADEVVTRTELRQLKGKLKHMVTGEVIRINPKGMSERDEANHMNFVFLSNELQPLALDKTDRRYMVLWTPPKLDESFYQEVGQEIRNGGVAAFYHYLLHKVPLGDFNEHTKPLVNDAKENLIALGLSPPERFFREWTGGFLPLPFVCCSADQLYSAFCRWCLLSGERFAPSKTMFGSTITRIAAGSDVRKRVVKYELGHDVKQRTVYLVGDDPESGSLAEFVKGPSELFESALRKYRNVFERSNDDGS